MLFIWLLLYSLASAQLVTFEENHWDPNSVIGGQGTVGDFLFTSDGIMATNYGFAGNYNGVSLYCYYGFNNTTEISVKHVNGSLFRINSISTYQVSEKSTDTLFVQGYFNDILIYEKKYYGLYSWQILELNYDNINKLVLKSEGTSLSDYNYDNFDFYIISDITNPHLYK